MDLNLRNWDMEGERVEPTRDLQVTLVDVLDRLLDKGLILSADLLIHVAGVPLLGVNLKACLAGLETMLQYGIWNDWDAAQRAIGLEERRKKKGVPLEKGEEVCLQVFASYWYSKGIYQAWRPGYLYLTGKRLFLYRSEPAEMLFSADYEEIVDVNIEKENNIIGEKTDYLYLQLRLDEVIKIHTTELESVADLIKTKMHELKI